MLSHTKLINALSYIGRTSTTKYINDLIFDNAELVDSEWVDSWKNEYWQKPTQINSVTFQRCTATEFEARGNSIIIYHIIWDGDSFNGSRTKKRCVFTLKLEYAKNKCPLYKYISDLVEGELAMKAIALYDKELQDAKNKRVNEILQNIIGSL